MNKYVRVMVTAGIFYFLAVIVFFFLTGRVIKSDRGGEKAVLILNDITETARENGLLPAAFEGRDFGADFVILDGNGKLICSSGGVEQGMKDITVAEAVRNRYPYSCLTEDGKVKGYVIVTGPFKDPVENLRYRMTGVFALCGLIMLIVIAAAGLYIWRNIIVPFRSLCAFAGKVAEGRLDEPLPMDRDNMFGAFSESFDIMREELLRSRERELELQRKERELVASLSHDLRTPVTGIKLTAELLKAKADMQEQDSSDIAQKADNILDRAEQIDDLLNDLFDSTLDDLGQFRVSCTEEKSKILCGIIKKYDTMGLVHQGEVPGVLIRIDEKRMGQVIGNIISNSEKYAGTPIDVTYRLENGFLLMRIADEGPGIPKEEAELVTNKFYRGKQWKDSDRDGNGLGLYIAPTLMEMMGGRLSVETAERGFCVVLQIALA